MLPTLLSIDHLSVAYRTEEGMIPAVRDVSLALYPGEVLALVGESAAGKTSVGHAVLGLLPGNATLDGTVRYRDTELTGLPAKEMRRVSGSHISIIFQDA